MQEKGNGRGKSGNALGACDICNNPLMINKIWQGEESIVGQRNEQRHKGGLSGHGKKKKKKVCPAVPQAY